jgi:AcrR family transcriptional regulator
MSVTQPAYRRLPEEKQERILASARELFAENGLENTSTKAIAKNAGVSEGILFHHFSSKRGLLAKLAEVFAKETADAIMPGFPITLTEELILRNAFAFVEENSGLYRLFMKANADLRQIGVADRNDVIVSRIRQLLAPQVQSGEVRKGNLQVMAELQFAVVEGAIEAWQKTGAESQKEDFIQETAHCMRAMLLPHIS